MVYTTKFYKIGMFKRFILPGDGKTYIRVGRKQYEANVGDIFNIPSLGTDVIQVEDSYYWSGTPT